MSQSGGKAGAAPQRFAVVPQATGLVEWYGQACDAEEACYIYLGQPRMAGAGFVLENMDSPLASASSKSSTCLRVFRITPEAEAALSELSPDVEGAALNALESLAPEVARFEAVMVRSWLKRFRQRVEEQPGRFFPELQSPDRAWETLLIASTNDPTAHMTRVGGVWAHGRDLTEQELLHLARRLRRAVR